VELLTETPNGPDELYIADVKNVIHIRKEKDGLKLEVDTPTEMVTPCL